MGLGKTVQIVTYLEHLYRVEKVHRPFLVVVPLSTVEHWRREFEGWTDMICCVYHDRQRVWRDVLREYEWYYEDRPHTPEYLKFDVLVTTYDTLIGDFDVISNIPFRVSVVDEAHRLRNQKGKLLECMKEISAKGTLQYGFQSRVLMSGTPLQNDLVELWTLLNFIEPFKFPDLDQFMMQYGNMANREQVEALQQQISPYMLRRVKEDVAKDIPNKEETVIDVELTSIQKQYYRAIFEHNHAFLNMGATRTNAPKLMNIQMELRKVCNHPCLLEGVEHREQDRQFKEFLEAGAFEGKTAEEQQRMLNEHLYIQTSGKMVLLDKLLPKLRQEGHKVLIFSQMVRMLDLISEYCDFRDFPHERLDGRVRGTDRQKSIDRFEREKNSFLFLLSTRAGGVGINLTAADTCIIFDSDWNPQNDVQAQARCHRIGQTKDVRIYRLITSRSFEQEMFDRASKKLGLEQAVLGTFGQDEDDDRPTNQEMEQLLKRGAYALIEDENDEITKAFCADDIDSILAKRTRTRVVEGAKTASWLNKQGMVVSKSKFTSDSKTAGLDMADPLFWQKVMPNFVTASIMSQKLDDLESEIMGTKKKVGRGRGRWKKKWEEEAKAVEDAAKSKAIESKGDDEKKDDEASPENQADEDGDTKMDDGVLDEENQDGDELIDERSDQEEGDDEDTFQLSRGSVKKVAKFISDLKAMMEGIFDEAEDDALPNEEKQTCQKLLLTISVKEKLFSDEQRHLARSMLKRLEGNRRRRCRTSEQPSNAPGMSPGRRSRQPDIREELLIVGKKKKQRRKRRRGSDDSDVDDDGYKIHSDDEADWSDIGEDIYEGKKRATITSKEAKRRRAWATDVDAATAAGLTWPVLPRTFVVDVLGSLIAEVIKHDELKGGVFSEPVSKDDFPEYYEQIDNPMDYGTMKEKLEHGEYRSAQAMQKDFILVMQNCLKFNAPDSEIVQEARQQTLMRPGMLREAAMKHNLFLAEDGTVFEVEDDKKKGKTNDDGTVKRPKRKKDDDDGDNVVVKKRRRRKNDDSEVVEEDDIPLASMKKKKPRIKISVPEDNDSKKAKNKRSRLSEAADEEADADVEDEVESTPVPRKKKERNSSTKNKKKQVQVNEPEESASDIDETAYLDANLLKTERESLDESFDAAKEHFTKRGPWHLPSELKPDKFKEIALGTLAKIGRADRYNVFAEPVSEEEAPGYFDVVDDPIDMATMKAKVESGDYGDGSKAAAKLYKDFLLMFENCAAYNDDEGEVLEEAARLLALVPETFATQCTLALKKQKK
jgi:chromodomain-helicase-DNA-binding protein 7